MANDAADIGSASVNPGTVDATTPTQSVPSTPSPISLRDDSLIALEGFKEPVKFGDHVRGLKRDHTKLSQENAKYREQLKEFEALRAYKAEQERRLQALGAPVPQADPSAELLSRIKGLGYLTGADAYELAQHIQGQVGGYGKQFQTYTGALLKLAQTVQALQGHVNGFQSQKSQVDFETKINGFLKAQDLGDEYKDLATELYLAYEPGEQLDAEFPSILKQRIEQVEKAIRARDKKRIAEQRKQAFVPGDGGKGSAGAGLKGRFQSPAEVADALWPGTE